MWQAKGIEENVHNVVGVITRNPRRCLVACIVRCISCWHVLTSARQIFHSKKMPSLQVMPNASTKIWGQVFLFSGFY